MRGRSAHISTAAGAGFALAYSLLCVIITLMTMLLVCWCVGVLVSWSIAGNRWRPPSAVDRETALLISLYVVLRDRWLCLFAHIILCACMYECMWRMHMFFCFCFLFLFYKVAACC
ncbi:unnamed protein product [Ceratitis capitata]|uniref:(Mediterranean fruit fly) hypothetical protein n=1 Tax=Ceratitis capitata TaxID=7213 RepID=A0A811UES9_CERCA|nr:unnamed protein product [Ceratitis capitata]